MSTANREPKTANLDLRGSIAAEKFLDARLLRVTAARDLRHLRERFAVVPHHLASTLICVAERRLEEAVLREERTLEALGRLPGRHELWGGWGIEVTCSSTVSA